MLRGAVRQHIVAGIVSLSLLFPFSKTYAENENAGKESLAEKVKEVASVKKAYAMPASAPLPQNAIVPVYNIKPFLNYANQPVISKFSEKKFTREELEKIPIYKRYYFVKDKGDKIEEKVTEGINKSRWKDRVDIDKISTKFSEDELKLQIKIKENKKRPKSIFGKMLQNDCWEA